MKRQRGRSRRNNNQHNANRSMESNGPDVKVRGTAKQIFDKYETLARDAASSGSRVKAENYRQHAEHYLRIVNAIEAAKEKAREEAEAAKAESGDSSGEDASEENDNRSRRRYPPQVKKSSETDATEKTGDDIEPSTDNDDVETGTIEKSSRRRKAPKRDASDTEDTATEAAE